MSLDECEVAVIAISIYAVVTILLILLGRYCVLAVFVPLAPIFVVLWKFFSWVVALTSVVVFVATVCIIWSFLLLSARSWYRKATANNIVSVDQFVANDPTGKGGAPSAVDALKVMAMHKSAAGDRTIDNRDHEKAHKYKLTAEESPHVPGLYVTKRCISDDAASAEMISLQSTAAGKPPLVIGTIRMGFGHHRIAYAAASWGASDPGRRTFFHDLLNITPSDEASLIKNMDALYSKGSRITSEIGGAAEKAWGAATKSGDANSLRATYQMGELVTPLLRGLDRETPIVCSHSLVACAAVAAGFSKVINLVIDNHAQWFVVTPGCLNLVQGPGNYRDLRRMGVPEENVRVAGHWCPHDLVTNIWTDCDRRISRAVIRQTDKKKAPLRLLIPVGGAGAQRKFVTALIGAVAPLIQNGTVQIFLNAGDHQHMRKAFVDKLDECGLPYATVDSMEGVYELRDSLLSNNDPKESVTLLAFDDYFPAVATTDVMCRAVDVLLSKPSELAFYCLPKIMVRRVGDHEAYSATRASELGDGTCEARTVDVTVDYLRLMTEGNGDMLVDMCECVKRMAKVGVYDGCKVAVQIATQMAKE